VNLHDTTWWLGVYSVYFVKPLDSFLGMSTVVEARIRMYPLSDAPRTRIRRLPMIMAQKLAHS
jgi:hypothetical protein